MTWRGAGRAATIALFATAAGVAATPLRAQDISCERGDQEVRALEFRGNRAITDDDLSVRVVTTMSSRARRWFHLWFAEKRCLDHAELPRDVLRIKAYYRERGYYKAQVDTLVQPMGRNAVRVVFTIDEGLPVVLAAYDIIGLDTVPEGRAIRRRLRLHRGEPFDLARFRADMDTIVQRLRNAGYYRAEVLHAYDTNLDSLVASASITVLPGVRATFGEPVFDITPVDDRAQELATPVVRRVMRISPGEQYSDRAIVDAQRNLFQLGAYRHIEVGPLPDSLQPAGDSIVVLGVRLTEDYMRQLDSEIGWATLDCGRVRLQYTDKNLLGTARRLEVTGQMSKIGFGDPLATAGTRDACNSAAVALGGPIKADTFSYQLHYYGGFSVRQPRLLGTRWVPTLSLYSERRGEYKAYLRSTLAGGDFSATRELGDRMPLRLGYTMEYGSTDAPAAAFCALFNRCDLTSQQQLKDTATLGVASATLARLRTDNVINPSSGTAMRAEIRTSASQLLGTSQSLFFNKASGDVAWYHPLGYRNTVSLRLRGGVVVGRRLALNDPGVFIPPQERLYAGGPTSVRGFQQNELGSVVYIARELDVHVDTTVAGTDTTYQYMVDGGAAAPSPERVVPLGGNTLFVTNIEYRLRDPFLWPDVLQYTLFLDGGAVWSRPGAGRLRWTPGFGVRALTPVGPVQVNVGINVYEREPGAIYYNPNVETLACATPGNTLMYRRNPDTRQLIELTGNSCGLGYTPPARHKWYQKLTFTFSIGPDF